MSEFRVCMAPSNHRCAAAAAALLLCLAVAPPGRAAAKGVAGRGWISQIHWSSRHVAPGVTVRHGVLSDRAGTQDATTGRAGYDQGQAPVTEQIYEAIVDPRRVRIEVTHDGIVARRQTTSLAARTLRALVATNAGFFITSDADGFPGAPAGLAVYGGHLESMNNGRRAALLIKNGRPRIADLVASVIVRAGRSDHPVNGINRIPGIIEDCGRPGSIPTSRPRQDVTCTDNSELVLFTAQFGASAPSGDGTQADLGPDGRVRSVGAQTGGRVPAGGSVIEGIGAAGTWLARHAIVGRRLIVSERVADAAGHAVPLSRRVSIASAAPMLLENGRVAIDAAREGVLDPADPSFNYAWANQPQPRTIAGIDRRGRLILVTVDGRQPGRSQGLTLRGEAALMRALGAVVAMNLDGGGSTAMAVNGRLVNHPSDSAGQRADGDFVVVLPPTP